MKISLNWIKEYINAGITAEALAHKLTMAGLEVEEVSKVGSDTVFELEVTPNRADCLSMIGMSREVSAVLNKTLKMPKIKTRTLPNKKVSIKIEDTKDCKIYLGTLIENVEPKSSPNWIKEKISSIGIRPISNLVDITNFCMMENGQPLHVFDYDKIEGGSIVVRRAKKGEKIITIDDVERELDPSILVIADAKKPIAIAGIMGGKHTEVSSSTKNVLLESAYFNSVLTRRASRKLGLGSDSSYRFERGVDLAGVGRVSNRAIDLILELAGGKITKHRKAGSSVIKNNKVVKVDIDRINSYLGTDFTLAKVKNILSKLGFKLSVVKTNRLNVTAPTFRSDIASDVDVIEEVARVVGYDNLPETMPNIKISNIETNSNRLVRKNIRDLMIAQGFSEAVTFSLLNKEDLSKANIKTDKIAVITNPLSLDQEVLQPSSLPSLLSVVKTNINRGQKDLKMFELGKVYSHLGKETETISVVMTGVQYLDWRNLKKMESNVYDIKGAIEYTFSRIGITNLSFKKSSDVIYDDELNFSITHGQKVLGSFGLVNEDVLKRWGIKKEKVLFAQVNIPYGETSDKSEIRYKPFSNYPAVSRDISLAVDQSVSFDSIKKLVIKEGSPLLTKVEFNEEYMGDKIPEGQRGIIFSLVYQSTKKTLTENEVSESHSHILQKVVSEFNATVR